MYSCIACKCHRPQLEIRISLLLMACLQMFGVLCSCSYCSVLRINPSRKLLSSWCNIMVIGQWNTCLFCIHFTGQKKKIQGCISSNYIKFIVFVRWKGFHILFRKWGLYYLRQSSMCMFLFSGFYMLYQDNL